ncbi:MAG TPA: rod shape-determining protein MreC, partial [Iamia sp.]|nr:rod shape-determining protein MreC [Iamia sp.]
MPASRRFGRSRFTLILLVLASLTVLTLDYRDTGPVQGVRRVFGTVFSPFEGIGNAIASPFEDAWKGIFEYDDLEDENRDLQRQIDALKGLEVAAQADREDLAELQRLENLPIAADIEHLLAKVTSGPLTDFDSTFEINRGSGDGIKREMVVMTEAGLVGRVESVEGGTARIRVITDPDYPGFGVKLVEARDVGIAHAAGQDGMVQIDEGIQPDTAKRGDAVVTSGLDRSAYPPNIPVGEVESVRPTGDLTEQVVVIDP